ncbi:MAG: beta-propeller domain-containing protein [archaeon]
MEDKDGKFIMMDIDDKRSKKIAEVMGNETCKKIIDYLTYNYEKSEEDIANALDMKINTVEYNLKKLLEAGLVDKATKFFWSKKGKKIMLYKLAKKHIVISPKNTKINLTALKTIIPVIISIALVVALIALSIPSPKDQEEEITFKTFESIDDLKNFLKENQDMGEFYGTGARTFGSTDAVMAESAVGGAATSKSSDSAQTASDYSETNIQVAGVDEPDIVKNDGKYIYAVSGNKIVLINAYPAENMKIISEINTSRVINIFVNQDKLIVFASKYSGKAETQVLIYDISDRENPELEQEISVDGNYVSARMINNYVYLIANQYVGFSDPYLPGIMVGGVRQEVAVTDIAYFPHPDTSHTFTNILAVDIQDANYELETYLTGASHNIYVSEDNLYLTYTKRISSQDYYEEFIEDVILSLLPSEEKAKANQIIDSDDAFYEKAQKINEIVEEYSDNLRGSEKAEFDKELLEKTQDFAVKLQKRTEKTIIHKININELDIEYVTNGNVPGHILNQFSMDEYKGNFRIATTTGNSWGNSNSLNHLFVLNEDLEILGSVDDLAEGERIYSTRFIGERAYMVTFKQVDPLFVINLSDPENPEVLGQLKVTGFSSYLHPYDENHVIGIGKEATEEGRVQGVKIALFDVSDVENPIEKAKYEVQGKYSNSNALYDHKAFLFDKERNLLVLPMSYSEEWESTQGIRKYEHWQGAFVFNINKEDISFRGMIDHKEDNDEEGYYYGPYAVQRSLYMDDILYTISRTMIKANDLNDLDEINKVKLPYENQRYYLEGGGNVGVAVVGVPEVDSAIDG